MMAEQTKQLLSEDIRNHIDDWVKRYPPEQKRSGVFEALRVVQEKNNNYLTTELMDAVADYLGMPAIAVYEVATFYTMYHDHPVGRHVLEVCTNVPCMLSGSGKIADHLKQRLGINWNETTPDNRVTIKEVECLGACVNAPVCQLGNKYIENLTPEKIDEILASLT
jgi:NADH-quinone oxidoreductase subunit E